MSKLDSSLDIQTGFWFGRPNWILVWTSKLDSSLENAAIQNVAPWSPPAPTAGSSSSTVQPRWRPSSTTWRPSSILSDLSQLSQATSTISPLWRVLPLWCSPSRPAPTAPLPMMSTTRWSARLPWARRRPWLARETSRASSSGRTSRPRSC